MALPDERTAHERFERYAWNGISSAWHGQSQRWVPEVGRVVVAALGEAEIEFLTGYPGSVEGAGRLLAFTRHLVADVEIEHPETSRKLDSTTPMTTVHLASRSRLRAITVKDGERSLAWSDDDFGGLTNGVVLELRYDGLDRPLTIEVTADDSNPQRKALTKLLPGLVADLGGTPRPSVPNG